MLDLTATITCPTCHAVATETMPTDRCQYLYECRACGAIVKPKPGDCCVYCSYANRPCPIMQQSGSSREPRRRG